jgi:hypothetical protein
MTEALRVNVMQTDRRRSQLWVAEDIPQQVLGEDGAPGSEERNS